MNKTGWFCATFFAWITTFMLLLSSPPPEPTPVVPLPPPIVKPPEPPAPIIEPDLVGVQVPISKAHRVYNKSGSQCVWCSIECLSRYHGIKSVYEGDNRITKHYTWATGPGEVQRVLSSRYSSLKWKQIQSKSQMKEFIKKYVCDKKFGIAFGVPHHMLNLIHYDEKEEIVKVIDNQGPKALQVQTWSMDMFNRIAEGWVLTVFPPDYTETTEDHFDCSLSEPNKLYGSLSICGRCNYRHQYTIKE